jgi:NADH-quinone oxidoreductase subunit L
MITHAFFKALLFLGAGSVIHGMEDEQDIRRMGALRKLMPITAGTFIVGWLAIAGVPPFSGFWSKDEILTYALHQNVALYVVGLFTALLTAFYMSRQVFLVFYGEPRWNDPVPSTHEAHSDAEAAVEADAAAATAAVAVDEGEHHDVHPHESPWTMTVPLVVLAVLAAIAGFINLPFSDSTKYLEDWLEPVTGRYGAVVDYSNATIVALLTVSTIVALTGIGVAYVVYRRRRLPAAWFEPSLFLHGWYYDWAVSAFMGGPGRIAADALAWFDRTVIDGAVNGIGALARDSGSIIRRTQSGLVRTYALALTIGAVLLVLFVLTRVNW